MKIIAIYPGRFQPFGRHHKAAFDWLCSKFGAENCYVCTSDKVDIDSPLTFDEKVTIINKFGIRNVLKSKSPYKPVDLGIDPSTVALVVMLGSKDAGRIKYTTVSGSPGYYAPYTDGIEFEPMSVRGYIVTAPHVSIQHNGNELSGTYLRMTLPEAPQSTFSELMGWYDADIQKMLYTRSHGVVEPLSTTSRRSIQHLNESLSIDEIVEVVSGLVSGDIPAYEKFDGVNLKVTTKNNSIYFARNKTDISNPITPSELIDRFMDRPWLCDAFGWGILELNKYIRNIIQPGEWLNVEIVHPLLQSTYRYHEPMVIMHEICTYDVAGNMLTRNRPTKTVGTLMLPNRIIIPKMDMYVATLKSWINRQSDLESAICRIGYTILHNSVGYKATESHIIDRINEVGRMVGDYPDVRQKYFSCLERTDMSKILPFEGIVFDWRGNTYKMTGYYKHINAILHLI